MLRLLHTADWHLGRRFPSFPEDAQRKLSRARMDVIASILDVARRNAVHALLCAGDLFDDPEPEPDFGKDLQERFSSTLLPIHRYSSYPATTIRSHLSLFGRQTIHFGRDSQSGCTLSIVMTSHTIWRPMLSYMHGPADRKQERTTWRWRFRPVNPAMNGFGLGAFMALRSTLMGTRRTFRFAEMQESNEDWTISQ